MSFLYTLSNVLVPFSLLIFSTLKRSSKGQNIQYGKWLLLFLLTFIFNGLFIFHSTIITLIDLAVKVSLYFIPDSINQKIEEQISHLHLQGVIESLRCKTINGIALAHQKITFYFVNKLRPEEGEQFKNGLINCLNGSNQFEATIQIKQKIRQFENTAVNCTLITPTSKYQLEQKSISIQHKKQQPQKIQKKVQIKKNYQAQKQYPPVHRQSQKDKLKSNLVSNKIDMYKTQQPEAYKQKKVDQLSITESMKNIKQSSQYLPDDFEDDGQKQRPSTRQSRLTDNKISQIKKPAAKKQQTGLMRRNTDIEGLKADNISSRHRSMSPQSQTLRDQAQILQKLDLSASEYSDLFQEDRDEQFEDLDVQANKIVCKVQAIVEIGTSPSSRLQIYNLQLYGNGDLRIVSLYNREFERHRLVSMKKGLNSYFELTLSGGSTNKRRVKFRGQHQAFNKYLDKA